MNLQTASFMCRDEDLWQVAATLFLRKLEIVTQMSSSTAVIFHTVHSRQTQLIV